MTGSDDVDRRYVYAGYDQSHVRPQPHTRATRRTLRSLRDGGGGNRVPPKSDDSMTPSPQLGVSAA